MDWQWFRRERVTLAVLGILFLFTLGGAALIGSEIYGANQEERASGIGDAATGKASRPLICQKLGQPVEYQEGGDGPETQEKAALRQYCVSVRANEIASANLFVTGWGVIFALISLALAVIAGVVSIRIARHAIDQSN